MKKSHAAVFAVATVVFALAGCSAAAKPIEWVAGTAIVDVRTPSEFADGHLAGAINVDFRATTFDVAIANLPIDGEYVIYCASGNRSASAHARMTERGFGTVTDAHGMSDAAASTGLAIVTTP